MAKQVEQLSSEAARARREMLAHLSQREYHLPRKSMKAWMQSGPRKVWADLIKFDSRPRRELYMRGR